MDNLVIDTNVMVVANGKSNHVGAEDTIICQDFLFSILNGAMISIDTNFLIFSEYFNNVKRSGQPGVGDLFVKWLWDNQYNQNHCERVKITPIDDISRFEEIAQFRQLDNFDDDDKKFVAVAITSVNDPEICNASDSDWWSFSETLKGIGVSIRFLCPSQIRKWSIN